MITPEQQEIILEAIDSALIDVHTGLPAVVEKYYDSKKTVDLVLGTKRMLEKEDGSFVSEELPKLPNVPVHNTGSSLFGIGFALAPGDDGFVMFAETSIDQWRTKGQTTSPSDIERHGLGGGVFVPGPLSVAKTIATAIASGAFFGSYTQSQLRANGATMEVTTAAAPTASDFVAMAALVLAELNAIKAALTAHTHGGVTTGSGSTTGGVHTYSPSSVASTNLKAD